MSLILGFVNNKVSLANKTYNTKCPREEAKRTGGRKRARRVGAGLALPNRTPKACSGCSVGILPAPSRERDAPVTAGGTPTLQSSRSGLDERPILQLLCREHPENTMRGKRKSQPQAQTPVQDQSNVMPYGQRRAIRG
jgi:hypothetical protein